MMSSSWRWTTPPYVERLDDKVELAGIKEKLDSLSNQTFWKEFGCLLTGIDHRAILRKKHREERKLKERRKEILASYGHVDDEQEATVIHIDNENADTRNLRVLTQELKSTIANPPCLKTPRTPAIIRYWWLLPAALGVLTILL